MLVVGAEDLKQEFIAKTGFIIFWFIKKETAKTKTRFLTLD